MAVNFFVIGMTPEMPADGEAARISAMLSAGVVDRFHIRHPWLSMAETRKLLQAVPAELHDRISLHDNYKLAEEFPGVGIHLNARNSFENPGCRGEVSRSCHTLKELDRADEYSYVTLSPIYNSISKQGYKGAFKPGSSQLGRAIYGRSVMAMGGVTPSRFSELCSAGFSGAVMLGYIWDNDDASVAILRARKQLHLRNFDFQFITDSPTVDGTVTQVMQALEGYCKWIQIRMKEAPVSDIIAVIEKVMPEVRANDATLIVDDHVEIARDYDVAGVHLGHNDMPPSEAREILGPGKVIGYTINTLEQAQSSEVEFADYFGVGPFNDTRTKKNLAPVLGAAGIKGIVDDLRQRGIEALVVAIGGIGRTDIKSALKTGAAGVAVSGAITRAADPAKEAAYFAMFNQLNNIFKK